MQLALIFLAVLTIIELAIWLPFGWRIRQILAAAVLLGLSVVSGFLIVNYFSAWALIISFLSVYRVVNLLRVVQNRIHADYLYHAGRRTTLWLIGLQALVYILALIIDHNHLTLMTWLYTIAGAQLGVAAILLASTRRNLRTTRPVQLSQNYASKDLPTVTVAIPARNETSDLEECLKSLVASNYPKLEVLVLDDCSQNKRTPEIIREFAQDGVRFMAGKVPPGQWLAKNYAYDQLADEANGEVLMFCGVDTRFSPDSIGLMVRTLLEKHKYMLCVIPKNELKQKGIRQLLLQPARYAWEFSLPRRMLNRPPVLSSCWLIRREALEKAGGFDAVSRKAVPESYLARRLALQDDGYTIVQSDTAIGVGSVKGLHDQQQTALRTRYPQLHRRPELVAVVSAAQFLFLVWPLAMIFIGILAGLWPLAALSLATYVFLTLHYANIVSLTYRRFMAASIFVLPIAALYDIGVLNYSMWKYEFGEVIWKGRNICVPVMRVIPELPKLD